MVRAERKDLAEFIEALEFNREAGGKFLVMISGDIHQMGYDHGGQASNPFGGFPLF